MKKLLSIAIIIVGLNSNAQEIMTDWKELDGKTTLKEYIENQAYDYLNFKPTENDTLNDNGVKISHRSATTKVIIRDRASIPDIPLVVINEYPTDEKNIWNSVLLADIKKITLHKPTEQTSVIYGKRGGNGLIFVEMDKRKWRKIKRKIR
ncbi:hypothetical protein [Allomuricauda sp. ARW1Y1]|jgi:hypothetical protein|uniref:hypothetical protein n=1 Tax=Allomuricauda sp. ARW1Y1 TaxID=2663843 RepID=UPI0015CD8E58|nr:hypothetical protein [Muricauda sp. ARW1Y1]NYJ27754.1 hypothetical protein [Muricauda sp. ARW1Y1]